MKLWCNTCTCNIILLYSPQSTWKMFPYFVFKTQVQKSNSSSCSSNHAWKNQWCKQDLTQYEMKEGGGFYSPADSSIFHSKLLQCTLPLPKGSMSVGFLCKVLLLWSFEKVNIFYMGYVQRLFPLVCVSSLRRAVLQSVFLIEQDKTRALLFLRVGVQFPEVNSSDFEMLSAYCSSGCILHGGKPNTRQLEFLEWFCYYFPVLVYGTREESELTKILNKQQ